MFKLDILAVNFILNLFPWSNYALYGFGIYAKFILLLLFGTFGELPAVSTVSVFNPKGSLGIIPIFNNFIQT